MRQQTSTNDGSRLRESITPMGEAVVRRTTLQMTVGQNVIAFDDTGGDGHLVIAVPGMGDVREEYRFLEPFLTAAGYRLVTVDVRGHGDSSAVWDDYSAHAVGRDLLALITHLGRQTAAIIGNSFSAGSALWAAHDAREKVSGVVLIGPILRDPPKGIPWYMRALLALGLGGPWKVAFWLMYFSSLFPTRKPTDFISYRKALGQNLREPGRMEALKAMIYLSKSETEDMLARTDMPALVVMGTRDADFSDPMDEARWVESRIGAAVLAIEGAGHYPQTEMAQEVGPAIVRFLQACKP